MRITKKFIENLNSKTLQGLSEEDVVRLLTKANDAYRNKGAPIISDDMYDMIMEHLESRNPQHPYLKKIGDAVPKGKSKVKLPFFMGSLDKIKTDDRLIEKFKQTYACSYMVSEKLDGNSALFYVDGKTVQLFSRGDGTEGQDISHLLTKIQGIPDLGDMKHPIAVRGELIISRKDFEKVKSKGANARNMVAGIINAKRPDPEIAQLVQFVAYELLSPHGQTPELQFKMMKDTMGFKVVQSQLVGETALTSEHLSSILVNARKNSEFEVDGIVIMHNAVHKHVAKENPKYAFAFKSVQTMDKAEVVVTDIEWNISKDGYIIPVVQFQPVHLAGVTIQRAHGFNGKYIHDHKLGPGSRITIMRSGDVIPYILEVLSPSDSGKPMMPHQAWHWSDTGVDIILDDTSGNDEVALKNLQYFFDKVDVKGVSSATIKKLYDAGYTDVRSILNISRHQLLKIDGFKDKTADKITSALQTAFADIDCVKLMDASNTLGRGMGSKKLALVVTEFPTILTKHYVPTVDELVMIRGIEKKTAETINANLPKFFEFLKASGIKCKVENDTHVETAMSNHLSGMSFVFSGFRDKDLEALVASHGGVVTGSVSKKTSAVIVASEDASSSKVVKAKELGVPVYTLSAFKKDFLKNK